MFKTNSSKIIICGICLQKDYHEAFGLCKYCYNELRLINKHLDSPLIKCSCNPECNEIIHSINTAGLKALYKHGHRSKGNKHWNWKGGDSTHHDGYITTFSPKHPFRSKRNRVLKHRLVMEKHLGRYLEPNEVVHHKDHNPSNNNIENLQLFRNNVEHILKTNKKDFSDRFCHICKSNNTSIRKDNGMPIWCRYNDQWTCRKCYRKVKKEKRNFRRH